MSATVSAADRRRGALDAVDRIVNDAEASADAALQRALEVLRERFDHYSWVGIYRLQGDELVLGPWTGPQATEHVRIPVGQGVCGAAAASGRTEVVDDVAEDPRYLACFASTRSEVVVPVRIAGRIVGELDIDSDRPAAFTADDVAFLEHVARMLASRWRD